MTGAMRAGFASAVITPPAGVRMSGYRLRREPAAGTHDELQARCAVLDDGRSTCALVSLDLIGLEHGHAAAVKGRIAERCGLQPERVLLACTHTHSGPDTLNLHGSGVKLEHYCGELYRRVADCVAQGMDRLETTAVSVARCGVPGLAFNRRLLLRDGSVRLNLERIEESRIAERGPADPGASILLFAWDGEIRGAVTSFTLHATVLDQENLLFTRDWPGYLVDALQEVLPGDPMVLFFNGAFGNINQIERPGIWVSTFREAERIGTAIARKLAGALESAIPLPEATLRIQHAWAEIPRREGRSLQEIRAEIEEVRSRLAGPAGSRSGEEERPDLEKELIFLEEEAGLSRGPDRERVEVQRIILGEVEIIGVPGELFVEYGLSLKKTSPRLHCLVFGNANGSAGYIPLPESFTRGAYETRLSRGSRLVPEAGPMIMQTVEKMRTNETGRQS
jgi:neutral ceramidase